MRMFNYQNTQALYRDFDNMVFGNFRRKKSSSISSSSSDENNYGLCHAQKIINPNTSTFMKPSNNRNSYDDDLTLLEKALLGDVHLKKDGTPDMRYKINRMDRYNKDNSIDKRFKK